MVVMAKIHGDRCQPEHGIMAQWKLHRRWFYVGRRRRQARLLPVGPLREPGQEDHRVRGGLALCRRTARAEHAEGFGQPAYLPSRSRQSEF
jgi:hypothetical protein